MLLISIHTYNSVINMKGEKGLIKEIIDMLGKLKNVDFDLICTIITHKNWFD